MGFIYGELAQLGEHLPCTQGVKGSNPLFSTKNLFEVLFKLTNHVNGSFGRKVQTAKAGNFRTCAF